MYATLADVVIAAVWRTVEPGSIPGGCTNLYASETWKSERSYKPFSARLAFLRGFDPLRWYQHAVVALWEGNSLSARLRWVRFPSAAPNKGREIISRRSSLEYLPSTNLFREIQAWCKDLTVNQWLGEFDPHTRSQTIWGQ